MTVGGIDRLAGETDARSASVERLSPVCEVDGRAEAEPVRAETVLEAVQVAVVAAKDEVSEAFANGEAASFEDVLAELASVLPAETLPLAVRTAFLVFQAEMRAHLSEVRELALTELSDSGDPASAREVGARFSDYSKSVLALVRRASSDASFDAAAAFEDNARQMLMSVLRFSSLALHFQALVMIRVVTLEFKVRCAELRLRLGRELQKLAENEREFRELEKALEQAEEKIEKASKEVRSDPGVAAVLMAAVECRLAAVRRELGRLVAGFDRRCERERERTEEEPTVGCPIYA